MANSYEKYQKRKLISSYFSVIFSIFLVLFLLGTLSLFVVHSRKLSDNFRENIPMSIYLQSKVTPAQITKIEQEIESKPYIKQSIFVSKEDAAKAHEQELGEDFLTFLGFNPLLDSFDLQLNSPYVVKDSIAIIEKELLALKGVGEITYDKQLVDLVNENITRITQWMLAVTFVLAIVSMLLINSSLRLLIFSSRFTIKTMQMVGATKKFIRRPFIIHSIKLGLIASFIAIIVINALAYYIDYKFPDLEINPKDNSLIMLLLSASLLVAGIVITSISTYFATQRFLNLKSDELY